MLEQYNVIKDIPREFEFEGETVTAKVIRAKQLVEQIEYPLIAVDFGNAEIDWKNTPNCFSVNTNEDITYVRGFVVTQPLILDVYDNHIRRISKIAADLFKWAKQYKLTHDARMLALDWMEEVYRRRIEVICKLIIDWDELVSTIEEVEGEVQINES